MHMPAALDLASSPTFYRIRPGKRWIELLGLVKAPRARWLGERLYIVRDKFSPRRRPASGPGAPPTIKLVFLTTYRSWLNWIETESTALRYFTLDATDRRSHAEQNAAIAAYVRRRNTRGQPKINFAPGSRSGPGPITRSRLLDMPLVSPRGGGTELCRRHWLPITCCFPTVCWSRAWSGSRTA
jgi:hypothetical protein